MNEVGGRDPRETVLGLVPKDWATMDLDDRDLFEFENGLWLGRRPPYTAARVIRSTNFQNDGTIDFSDVAELPVELRLLPKKQLRRGDIVIERSGGGPKQPVGRVVFFNREDGIYSFGNFTSRLRAVDSSAAIPQFVFLALLEFHRQGGTLRIQHKTTGIRNLAFDSYRCLRLPRPPASEQQAIATVLSKIQAAAEAQDKIVTTLKELKAATMAKLFREGLRNEPLKQTDLGEIPQSWDLARIGDRFIFTVKPRGKRLESHGAIPFVRMEQIPSGRLFFSDFSLREPEGVTTGTYFEEGDLLVPKITPCFENGKQGIATDIPGGFGMATTEVIPIKEIAGVSDIRFLAFYLLGSNVRATLAGKMEGATGRQRLPKKLLEDWTIPFPALSEQRQIGEMLTGIQTAETSHTSTRDSLREIFGATLHLLMTGHVRVTELMDTENVLRKDVGRGEVTAAKASAANRRVT